MDAAANPETHLLRLLESGDVRQAAHVLVTQHADEVYGLCRAMLRDPTAAEDLSQDVFAKAFRALPGFRGDASVRTWILRITRNACIDHLRAAQREPWSSDVEPDAQYVEEPDVADLLSRRESISHALDALEEGERALVVLRFGHGLGYPELADAFAIKPGTVRMRVSRALTKMRAAASSMDGESAARAPMKKRLRRASAASAPPVSRSPAPPMGAPPAPRSAPRPPPQPSAPPVPSAPPAPGAPPPPQELPAPPSLPAAASAPRPQSVEGSAGGRGFDVDAFTDARTEADGETTADLGLHAELEAGLPTSSLGEIADDDATVPFQTPAFEDRDDTAPFSAGAASPARYGGPAKARGGSRFFGWLGRLFQRDETEDTVVPPPEAPPESAFSTAPPAALRDRLERMASDLE